MKNKIFGVIMVILFAATSCYVKKQKMPVSANSPQLILDSAERNIKIRAVFALNTIKICKDHKMELGLSCDLKKLENTDAQYAGPYLNLIPNKIIYVNGGIEPSSDEIKDRYPDCTSTGIWFSVDTRHPNDKLTLVFKCSYKKNGPRSFVWKRDFWFDSSKGELSTKPIPATTLASITK